MSLFVNIILWYRKILPIDYILNLILGPDFPYVVYPFVGDL